MTDQALPYPAQFYPGCPCYACDGPTWPESPLGGRVRVRMSLCPNCGNKRCPGAANHADVCSGSNEPGQPGSLYSYESVESGCVVCGTDSVCAVHEEGKAWTLEELSLSAEDRDRLGREAEGDAP